MRFLTFRGYLAALALALLVVGWWGVGRVQAQEGVMRHAVGTFSVTITPADPDAVEADLALARYAFDKTFEGGLTGRATGQMLAGGVGQARGVYVALERFVGTLDGRHGAFLMAHRGDMTAQGQTLSITIVPESGTGDLAGISGDFELKVADGQHRYDLAYRLPGD